MTQHGSSVLNGSCNLSQGEKHQTSRKIVGFTLVSPWKNHDGESLHGIEAQHGGAGPAAVDVLRHGAILLGKIMGCSTSFSMKVLGVPPKSSILVRFSTISQLF